jgi:hypothetical protein
LVRRPRAHPNKRCRKQSPLIRLLRLTLSRPPVAWWPGSAALPLRAPTGPQSVRRRFASRRLWLIPTNGVGAGHSHCVAICQHQGKTTNARIDALIIRWSRFEPRPPHQTGDRRRAAHRPAWTIHSQGVASLTQTRVQHTASTPARLKAAPGTRADTHDAVRTDRIDQAGSITLPVGGRLHHIGVGRIHYRTRVLILAQDLNIKIINATTGELLRELVLDPTRDYQPTGAPKGPTRKKPRT